MRYITIYNLLIRYSRGGVGDDGAGKQQESVGGLPVHVEIVAGSKQEQVAETQRGECVVKHAHYGKEYEERETIEQHAFSDNKLLDINQSLGTNTK